MKEGKVDLNKFKTTIASNIIHEVSKIRRIGVWTAELAVLRGLHILGALPE